MFNAKNSVSVCCGVGVIQHRGSQTQIAVPFTFCSGPQKAFLCTGCIKYRERNLASYIHEAVWGGILITFLDNYGDTLLLH